jgi:hypothetical protein
MAHEYYFVVNTDDDKGVPFGPVNKDNMDVSRLIVDFTCWLDPNETITQIAHMMIGAGLCSTANVGFGTWQSDYPLDCAHLSTSTTTPPVDTYPLIFARTSVFSAGKMVEIDVSGGTPGLTYAVSFTVTAGVSFRRRVIDICVAIDQPINPAMVGLGDVYPSFDFPLVVNSSTTLPYGFTGIVLVEIAEDPITITLPTSPIMGHEIRIKDVFGNAASFHITVNTVDGSLIDDTATYTIAFGFGNLGIVWTGSRWSIL